MSTHKMPFGKYSGQPLDELPTSYLRWLVAEVKLSTGFGTAVRAELARRGASLPPPPPPKALPRCRKHPNAPVRAYWFTQSDHRRAIRGECSQCGHWLGTLPQTPEAVALADAGTDRAALLTFMCTLEDLGVEVRREGDVLRYTPPNRMTRDLWGLERQCKRLLLDLLPDQGAKIQKSADTTGNAPCSIPTSPPRCST